MMQFSVRLQLEETEMLHSYCSGVNVHVDASNCAENLTDNSVAKPRCEP